MTAGTTTPEWDDARGFDAAAQRYRHELHVHCYRMLGSYTDAEDVVQDTLLRAWRRRDQLADRGAARAWLYKIATNCCLDVLGHSARRSTPVGSFTDALTELAWLQPYPTAGDDAADGAVARETIELAFIAALAHLAPRQRAVLVIRDVLGFTAAETAEVLDLGVTSVNSLLQRARDTVRRRVPADRSKWTPARIEPDEQAVLDAYMSAHERCDTETIVALLRDDVRVTMPPERSCVGLRDTSEFFSGILVTDRPGDWRLVPLRANGHPAAANYVRRPGADRFQALTIDVLRIEDGRIAEINCFLDSSLFALFGLPPEIG